MNDCRYKDECYFINYTIKHSKEFITNFRNNYCKGYYKKCAIWNVLNNVTNHENELKILPFEYSKGAKLLEETKIDGK